MREDIWNLLRGARLLKGKTALITGAAAGIGRSCAELFSHQGASLLLVDRDRSGLTAISQIIESGNGVVEAVQADLTNDRDMEKFLSVIDNVAGGIDVLVNCAGGGLSTPFFEVDVEEWRKIIKLNLEAAFVLSQKAGEVFRSKGGGAIVNISSLAGRSVSVTAGCHYTSSKAGLLGLTRHMASELAQYNIRVNAVCPGVINSDRIMRRIEKDDRKREIEDKIPLGRIGDVDEVAGCCLFLASDLSSYITGAILDVNGGLLMI